MNRKILILLAFILVAGGSDLRSRAETKPQESPEAPRPGGTPRMYLEKPKIDIGQIIEGQMILKKFEFKNIGDADLIITETKTTCGCTAALASTGPYRPGESGVIEVSYDSRGKIGHVSKDVRIYSNDPASPITIAIEGTAIGGTHPPMAPGEALFSGSCAECHSLPARGKNGKELYEAVCAICHDPPPGSHKVIAGNRQAMALNSGRELKKAISKGIPRTSMPGFVHSAGGPLSKDQVKSLVEYLESIRKK